MLFLLTIKGMEVIKQSLLKSFSCYKITLGSKKDL